MNAPENLPPFRIHARTVVDVTERNLAAIINTIPTAAWTTRPDGQCDFINQVWLDYVGMTAEQAQGWGWAEAIHPDDRQKPSGILAIVSGVGHPGRHGGADSPFRQFLSVVPHSRQSTKG
jgi:PAS domain-containing protein